MNISWTLKSIANNTWLKKERWGEEEKLVHEISFTHNFFSTDQREIIKWNSLKTTVESDN